MIVNGFFPISDISLQEGVNVSQNGASTNEGGAQSGDFLALLFLILGAPGSQGAPVAGDAEPVFATVSSEGGSIGNPVFRQTAVLYDANHHDINLSKKTHDPQLVDVALENAKEQMPAVVSSTVEAENYGDVSYPTNTLPTQDQNCGSQGESNGTALAADAQLGHGVAPQPKPVLRDAVKSSSMNSPDESSQSVGASVQRHGLRGSENPVAEASSFEGSAVDKKVLEVSARGVTATGKADGSAAVAPKEFFSTREIPAVEAAGMESLFTDLVYHGGQPTAVPFDDVGTGLTQTDMTAGAEIAPGNHSNVEPREAHVPIRDFPAYLDGDLGQTISKSAPHLESAGEPETKPGSPVPARDNLDQAVSTAGRADSSPDDGGLKPGRHLQAQVEKATHDRALSESIPSVGETRSPNSQHKEQGGFFRQGDRESAQEWVQSPFEDARHDAAPMHVARLTDNALAGSRELQAVNWRSVIDHVTDEIKAHIRIGKGEVVIRLDPPELGKLKIDLRLDGDKIEARILAEKHESRTLIESHLPELRQALGENRLEHVEVRIDSDSWGSARGDGQQGQRQEANGGRQTAHDNDGTARGKSEERGPLGRRPAAGEPGRVSMWA